MRILHLAPRSDVGTGIAVYAQRFRHALRAADAEVVQLPAASDVVNSIADVRAYVRAAVLEADQGFDVVHAELGGRALREFYAARAVAGAPEGPPVFATLHDPPRLVWWPFHAHGIQERRVLASATRRTLGRPGHALEAQVLSRLAGAFTLTRAGASAAAATFAESVTPIVPLPFAIDGALADGPPIDRARLVVGFFGYWYPGKGLERLADALSGLHRAGVDFEARLWGDISASAGARPGQRYRERVLQRLRDLEIVGETDALGFLDPDQVTPSLSTCDVIVLPYETSAHTSALRSTSAAMYDALSVGTPVVASQIKALNEVIVDGVNGLLVPPGDPDALTAALTRIATDVGLRTRLREGARATAAGFDSSQAATVALAGYRKAL